MNAIPKIIHQTWKNNTIPSKWKKYQEKVIALHPDWEYRLWADEDNDAFIQKHYPNLFPVYASYPKPIMKADVIRYAIMDQLGGVYLDLDYEFIQPFDFTSGCLLPKSRSISFGDPADRIGNCILASCPGHPFWKAVLRDLTENPYEVGWDEFDVEKATGPMLLTRIYEAGQWADLSTPERLIFHPPSPTNKKAYQTILKNGVSYGMHHADGSWRRPGWVTSLYKFLGKR